MKRRGIELVKELKRAGGTMTPYDTGTVDDVVAGIKVLWDGISSASGHSELVEWSAARHLALAREKLCAVVYLVERLEMLREARWELGSALPADLQDLMSPEERAYFSEYSKLVGSFMAGVGIDLNQDVSIPPSDLFIEVRGTGRASVSASAEAFTESGPVSLDPHVVQNVRRDPAVELLIRQGILEHV